jgi:hypothetical protein
LRVAFSFTVAPKVVELGIAASERVVAAGFTV